MADKARDILVRIKTEQKEAKQKIKEVGDELGKISDSSTKAGNAGTAAFNNMQTSAKGLQNTITVLRNQLMIFLFAYQTLKNTLSIAVEARNVAKNAEEIDNKFKVVFGEMADAVNDWVNSFGQSVGRARSDLKEMLSLAQDTFKPLGFTVDKAADLSKTLVSLAIDVASFNNKMDDEVLRDFMSALVGNHEATRKYGILITETSLKQEALNRGYTKNYDALTNLEKVQLRYNIIQDASKDAIGDAVRTRNDLTNLEKRRLAVQKDTYEFYGKKLIPITEAYNRTLIGFFEAINPTTNKLKQLNEQMDQYSQTGKQLNDLIKEYDQLKIKQELSADEQERLNIVIQKIAEISPGAITQLNQYGQALDINTEKAKALYEAELRLLRVQHFKAVEDTIDRYMKQKKALGESEQAVRNAHGEISELEAKLQSLKRQLADNYKAFGDLSTKTGGFATAQRNLRINIVETEDELLRAMTNLNKVQAQHNINMKNGSDLMNAFAAEMAKYFDVTKSSAEIAAQLRTEFGLGFIEAENLAIAIKNLYNIKPPKKPEDNGAIADTILTAEEMEKLWAEYYNYVKFLDENYYAWRIVQINKHAELLRKAGLTEVEITLWVNEQKKQLDQEFFEAHSSSVDDYLKLIGKSSEENTQVFEYASLINDALADMFDIDTTGTQVFANIALNFLKLLERMLLAAIAAKLGLQQLFSPAGLPMLLAALAAVQVAKAAIQNSIGAKKGLHVNQEQMVTVGEDGTEEVIIPVKKFFDFLLGKYKLPGGYGIENIPGGNHPAAGTRSIPAMYSETFSPVNNYYHNNGADFNDKNMVNLLNKMVYWNENIFSAISKINLSSRNSAELNTSSRRISQKQKEDLFKLIDQGRITYQRSKL